MCAWEDVRDLVRKTVLWIPVNVLCSLQYLCFPPRFGLLDIVGRPLAEAGRQVVRKSVLFSENVKSPNASVVSVCSYN